MCLRHTVHELLVHIFPQMSLHVDIVSFTDNPTTSKGRRTADTSLGSILLHELVVRIHLVT